jgi:YesN/AraC family two-component response regulator
MNAVDHDVKIVGETTNGKEAEDCIVELLPDLAILDIRMPVRTGLDILHTIKEHGLNTKVIFLSGFKEFTYAQDALEFGAQSYLTKPVDKEKLLQAVNTALRQIDQNKTARAALEKISMADGTDTFRKDVPIDEIIDSQINEQIKKIMLYMNVHYKEDINLETIAKKANMNLCYFSVFFKKNAGMHFKEFLTRLRLEHALALLLREDIKTYELAEKVGFTDPRYFSELFKKHYGKTPMEFKHEKKS